MSDNKPDVLRISRLLTPDHRADLLAWVHLAYVAETSARKSAGFGSLFDSVSSLSPQEYSCSNNFRRRKK